LKAKKYFIFVFHLKLFYFFFYFVLETFKTLISVGHALQNGAFLAPGMRGALQ